MKKSILIFTLLFLSLFFILKNNIFAEVSKFNSKQANNSISTNNDANGQNVLLPMSGNYSIGADSTNDFSSFTSAVLSLVTNGISGPITFFVMPGNYSEQITIPAISGASSTNTITFQSYTQDSSSVVMKYSPIGNNDNWVVKLNGAYFINFKNVSLQNTAINGCSNVVIISNNASFNKIQNCRIIGFYGASYQNANLISISGNNNSITNNLLLNGGNGIYFISGSGLLIKSNIIENQAHKALYLYYQNGFNATENIITSNFTGFTAIAVSICTQAIEITKNEIRINANTAIGILLNYIYPTNSNYGLIANNFISITGSGSIGIQSYGSKYQNIYHNSINIYGTSTGSCLELNGMAQMFEIKNNNFVNTGGGYIIYIFVPLTEFSSDYNNYYTTGTNFINYINNISSLSSWQSISGKDSNSISINPQFTSDTNLHIGNALLNNTGTFLNDVLFDIDDELRDTLTPEIGADEFSKILPIPIISYIGNLTFCENDSIVLHTPYVAGYSYQWKLNGVPIMGANDSVYSAKSSGSYTVTTSYLNSVPTTSLPINVTVMLPPLDLGPDSTICETHQITLDAGAGMDSYLWSTGDTTQSILIDSTGIGIGNKNFSVIVTQQGCVNSDTIKVTVMDCSGISENIKPLGINIYPNPSQGKINIDIPEGLDGLEIIVFNTIGQKILSELITTKSKIIKTIDLSELPEGLYYIGLKSEEKQKFVKVILN